MNFITVDELPESTKPLRTDKHNYEKEFESFMNMNVKFVRVDWAKEDYVSYNSACAAIRTAIRKFDIPAELKLINSTIYLVRTDL